MQHLQIQLPDQEDFKVLLKSIKQELLQEFKRTSEKKDEDKFLTRSEVAAKYRISLPTLNKHLHCGLPSFRVGKRRLFKPTEVEKYFAHKNQL